MNLNVNAHFTNEKQVDPVLIPSPNPMSVIGEISRLMNCRLLVGEDKNSLLQKSSRLLMIELARRDGVTQLDLVRATHLKAPTISVTLQKLEKDGFIERKTDSYDLRAMRVYLTEKGINYNRVIVKKVRNEEEGVLSCLTESENRQLMKLLLKIKENMIEDCEKTSTKNSNSY